MYPMNWVDVHLEQQVEAEEDGRPEERELVGILTRDRLLYG
jgi:hypothetical protein